jgi:hypothetical protein
MKYIITENKLESAIISYLNDNFYPDYGWKGNSKSDIGYQDEVDKWGEVDFYINDFDSYIYYGCNSGEKNDKNFEPSGKLEYYKCPLLLIYPRVSEQLNNYFGDMWKPIFKKWFEENTGLTVNQITDDYI